MARSRWHHHDQLTPLTWPEVAQDLRLARHWSDDMLIHSLEGCVWHGFLGQLRSFGWAQPVTPPDLAWAAGPAQNTPGGHRTSPASAGHHGGDSDPLASEAALRTSRAGPMVAKVSK